MIFCIRNAVSLRHAVGAGKIITTDEEESHMFLGVWWYWWLIIAAVLVISIPLKIKFVKWWNKYRQEQKDSRQGKWGDDE